MFRANWVQLLRLFYLLDEQDRREFAIKDSLQGLFQEWQQQHPDLTGATADTRMSDLEALP